MRNFITGSPKSKLQSCTRHYLCQAWKTARLQLSCSQYEKQLHSRHHNHVYGHVAHESILRSLAFHHHLYLSAWTWHMGNTRNCECSHIIQVDNEIMEGIFTSRKTFSDTKFTAFQTKKRKYVCPFNRYFSLLTQQNTTLWDVTCNCSNLMWFYLLHRVTIVIR